ncbi:AAA family ATPase [Streptomyces adelaidensis]|uniref:AAA family ATPase n=1 Tax=Streptomyces adelaidensis TaxID=2796465 RepID=UPI001908837B|nr:DUF3696 domain-containing protein [Streptomyces adelaidensis]
MIDRLTLTNFKAFQHADIPLGPLTLLTGLNSSGKSTVIQALALLYQSYQAGFLKAPFITDGNERRPLGGGGFLLNGELVRLGTGQDVLHEDFVGIELIVVAVAEGALRYAYGAEYEREQNLLPVTRIQVPATEEGSARPPGPEGLYPEYFRAQFQYLHADRITPAERYPRDHQAAIGRGFLGVRGEHTVNFLFHHAREEVPEGPLRHPRADSALLLDQVAAWMGELCPGVNIEAVPIEGTDTVRLSYGFGDALTATRRRRPTNVGFGLTYALPVVVACLTAQPGGLVLLENPEAHLHPQGQTRMAELAASAAAQGAQLIVETHSDHVLNGIRLAVKQGLLTPEQAVVHFFRSTNGSGVEVITPHIDEGGQLDQWPKGFFDELENTLVRLLD